jgi:TonB-linked SusC/RagA family outer membrane protein
MKKSLILLLAVALCTIAASAQITISGVVTDVDKAVLPGTSVIVKGSHTGTSTDANGRYSIVAKKGDIIEFSFIGMLRKNVTVGSSSTMNVQLAPEAVSLNEIVAIGYGSTKKSDLTGSVSSIKTENLANSRIGSVTNALQGLSAGVQVTNGAAKPGGEATVIIRGSGSINAGNAPLYIVDGIPAEGGLQDLSPGDIESIEILKDASAASIYGSRGSNGVVLVTTKKGMNNKGKVTFNASYGIQQMLNKPELMNAQQYYDLVSIVNPSASWTSPELRWLSKGESTDWLDAITQDGTYQNYNLAVSGGSDKNTHYLSIDMYDQDGIIKNSSFKKTTIRYNMDSQTTSWLKSGIRFNVIESTLKNINEEADSGYGTLFSAVTSQPTAPVYNEDGSYFTGFLNTKANPVAMVNLLDKATHKSRIVGSTYFEIEPVKNLKLKTDDGGEMEFYKINTFEDGRMGQHYTAGGHATVFSGKKLYVQSENTATYTLNWDKQKLVVMGGFSASKIDYENVTADAKNLSSVLKYNNLGGAASFGPDASYATSSTLTSFYGRVNYSLTDKYLVTATMRADGSSRFAPEHRWGYFPSLALAWRASEEPFIKSLSFINNLKVRASAGMLGNQNIGDFAYAATISQGSAWANYVFGNNLSTGAVQVTISNPDLTWEKAKQFDLGIDFGFLNNRIAGTIDGYYKITSDLLWNVPLPEESGFQNSLTNVGRINNKGVEFSLNSINLNFKDFLWTTALTFSYNHNDIAELYGGKQDVNKSLFVGHSINEFYLLKSLGIWQQSEASEAAKYNAVPGDRKIYDKDGNGVINGDDREFCGQSTPVFYGSFTNTLKYKGFDLTLYFIYAGGHKIYNKLNVFLDSYDPWGNMSAAYYNNYWTAQRPSNVYPAPHVGSAYANGDGTDAVLQRGDYLRLKNLELGYTLPQKISGKIKSSGVRFYMSVQNLFTMTKYTGFDVEANDQQNPYPNGRGFIGGCSINF